MVTIVRRLSLAVATVVIASTVAIGTASAIPTPVAAPTVTPGVAKVTVGWDTSPSGPYGSAPDRTYTVQLFLAGTPATAILTKTGLTSSPAVFKVDPSVSVIASVMAYDGPTPAATSDQSTPGVKSTAPAAPTGLAATYPASGAVRLSWNSVAGATSYAIYRGGVKIVNSTQRLYFNDSGLTNGTSYSYYVVALVSGLDYQAGGVATSSKSATLTAVPATVPAAPNHVTGTVGDRLVNLRFRGGAANGRPIMNVYVYIGTDTSRVPACTRTSTDVCASTTTANGIQVRNLSAERGYRFRLRARNIIGLSPYSSQTPMLQPFTIKPPFTQGMRGATIVELQKRLTWAGLPTPITGVFDSATRKQVKHLQEKFLYNETGEVSVSTWSLLKRITVKGAALPSQCRGTMICISKTQRVLRFLEKGKVTRYLDARFGPEGGGLATGEGMFSIDYKDGCSSGANPNDYGSLMANCHVSSGFGTPMAWSMFFNGGQAIHHSWYFARDGYWGNSHGCINIRDWEGLRYLYDHAPTGTPVYVYW
ncbi:MAG: L,D-transpeptidase family protein [Actinomycetes bacterium]